MPMDGGVEFSYAPELYTPPSPHLWNVNPKSLAWKLSGPPPAATQHSFVTPAFRYVMTVWQRQLQLVQLPQQQGLTLHNFCRSELALCMAAVDQRCIQLYPVRRIHTVCDLCRCADAFTSSRPPVAQHSKPPSAAAAAEAEASTTYTPASTSRANAVLGLDVAGYTSVVTRTPISPSGYAVPVQHMLPPPPHHHQQQQQQTASASGSIHMHGDPQLLSDSYAQPAAYFPDPSSSRTQSQPGAPAAAAAAALAALAGSHLRSTSAHVAGASAAGGYAQQYAAKNYTPPPLTSSSSSSSSSSRGSMLLWNIRQPPQQQAAGTPSSTVAVAGRRTVTAGHAGQLQAASAPGLVPDNHSSSAGSSSRPSSQESSPGLMKLKQLSTARLVRRLRTPPTAIAGSSGGGFGAGPAATAAAAGPGSTLQGNPAAGRRAAPVQVPRQQQQQPAQRQQQRQSQNTGSMARPANPPSYRRSSSNNSSSHREVLPVPAQAQPASRHANSTSGSGPEGFISRMMHGFSSSHAPAQAPQLPAGAEYVEVDRQPCPSCGRCFAPPALQQHMRICDKVFGQKRKVRTLQQFGQRP
jgi:hypothetical protein